MDRTVVDDMKRIHTQLRHFAHVLVLLYRKKKKLIVDRCRKKPHVAHPDPSLIATTISPPLYMPLCLLTLP